MNHVGSPLFEVQTALAKTLILEAVEGRVASFQRGEDKDFDSWLLSFVQIMAEVLQEVKKNDLEALVRSLKKDDGFGKGLSPSGPGWDEPDSCEDFVIVTGTEEGKSELLRFCFAENGKEETPHVLLECCRSLIRQQGEKGSYDARTRVTLKKIVKNLNCSYLTWEKVSEVEQEAYTFQNCAELIRPLQCEGDHEENGYGVLEKKLIQVSGEPLWRRAIKVTLATAAGGAAFYAGGALSTLASAQALISMGPASLVQLSQVLNVPRGIATAWALVGATASGLRASRRVANVTDFAFLPLFFGSNCAKASKGLPVFILVPGWFSRSPHPHLVWGGEWESPPHRIEIFKHLVSDCDDGCLSQGGSKQISTTQDTKTDLEEVLCFDDEWIEHEAGNLNECGWKSSLGNESCPQFNSAGVESEIFTSISDCAGWWRSNIGQGEEHILMWEEALLCHIRDQVENIFKQKFKDFIFDEAVSATITGLGIPAAEIPMKLLSASKGLDDPWIVVMTRAKYAGIMLAELLICNAENGAKRRPVTLIGFSFGARLIYYCLCHLAESGPRGAGLVENAVLLGAPVSSTRLHNWRIASTAVCGRLINGYSKKDWMLATIFRLKSWAPCIAGISPVQSGSVENHDFTSLIGGSHLRYSQNLNSIISSLHLET